MREATPEELKSVNDYIKSISYNPIVKELEEIKDEIMWEARGQFYARIVSGKVLQILDNHIAKLKGENNA